jgi:hypothetical protein
MYYDYCNLRLLFVYAWRVSSQIASKPSVKSWVEMTLDFEIQSQPILHRIGVEKSDSVLHNQLRLKGFRVRKQN